MTNGYSLEEREMITKVLNDNGLTWDDVTAMTTTEWNTLLDLIFMETGKRIEG